eukprot:454096-Prymnesium_polylepis.3
MRAVRCGCARARGECRGSLRRTHSRICFLVMTQLVARGARGHYDRVRSALTTLHAGRVCTHAPHRTRAAASAVARTYGKALYHTGACRVT